MIKLIKTIGGHNGAPSACKTCGSIHFIRTSLAWNCSDCGSYVPLDLSDIGIKEILQKGYGPKKK